MIGRHDSTELNTNKNFFSDNYIVDIFIFISVIISLLATTLTVYLLCKHKKLQTIIAGLVLHQAKEVGEEVTQKEVNSECKTCGLYRNNSDNIRFGYGNNPALQKSKIL